VNTLQLVDGESPTGAHARHVPLALRRSRTRHLGDTTAPANPRARRNFSRRVIRTQRVVSDVTRSRSRAAAVGEHRTRSRAQRLRTDARPENDLTVESGVEPARDPMCALASHTDGPPAGHVNKCCEELAQPSV
jgi:hypothetical protein